MTQLQSFISISKYRHLVNIDLATCLASKNTILSLLADQVTSIIAELEKNVNGRCSKV